MTHIEEEKKVVAEMIRIYCRYREGYRELCSECRDLLSYAHARLDRCPYGERKPSCRSCKIHCYNPAMASRIRTVMRYSGPRIILRHPTWLLMALRHM